MHVYINSFNVGQIFINVDEKYLVLQYKCNANLNDLNGLTNYTL